MNEDHHCSNGDGLVMRLMHLAHRLNAAAGKYFFAPYGLTLSTGRILMCLHHAECKTPTELTTAIGSKKSNMTQRIALLKKAGLVELRQLTEGDRRSVQISLTEKGKETVIKIERIFEEHVALLENALTVEQRNQTLTTLNLMQKTLNDFEQSHTS